MRSRAAIYCELWNGGGSFAAMKIRTLFTLGALVAAFRWHGRSADPIEHPPLPHSWYEPY